VVCLNCLGQTKENITVEFFNDYKRNPIEAYEKLFANNKWVNEKKSLMETNKIKLKDYLDQLGKYFGYELIAEKKAGESYVLKSFLVKYERQPVRFTFIIYRPSDTWQIQNFSYDDDIDTELKEASKVDRLRDNL